MTVRSLSTALAAPGAPGRPCRAGLENSPAQAVSPLPSPTRELAAENPRSVRSALASPESQSSVHTRHPGTRWFELGFESKSDLDTPRAGNHGVCSRRQRATAANQARPLA